MVGLLHTKREFQYNEAVKNDPYHQGSDTIISHEMIKYHDHFPAKLIEHSRFNFWNEIGKWRGYFFQCYMFY